MTAVHDGNETDLWWILRTAGPSTVRLAQSLTRAGIDAWTPTLTLERRRPRSTITVEREAPILPTFVFVRAEHLPELRRILIMPSTAHPGFSILRGVGRSPLITGAQMANLRAEEQREAEDYRAAKDRERRKGMTVPPVGTKVRVNHAPAFEGMTGLVEGKNGTRARINFGGRLTFEVEAWQLDSDRLEQAPA